MSLLKRLLVTVIGIALALATGGCDDKKSTSTVSSATAKPLATPSARTTRLDCGGSFGTCPPGEYCFYDRPGCDTTGFCGPAEPPCAHSTSFCGCTGIELACTAPKRNWLEKGTQCFTSEPVKSAASAAPSASAPPVDAGRKP